MREGHIQPETEVGAGRCWLERGLQRSSHQVEVSRPGSLLSVTGDAKDLCRHHGLIFTSGTRPGWTCQAPNGTHKAVPNIPRCVVVWGVGGEIALIPLLFLC